MKRTASDRPVPLNEAISQLAEITASRKLAEWLLQFFISETADHWNHEGQTKATEIMLRDLTIILNNVEEM